MMGGEQRVSPSHETNACPLEAGTRPGLLADQIDLSAGGGDWRVGLAAPWLGRSLERHLSRHPGAQAFRDRPELDGHGIDHIPP